MTQPSSLQPPKGNGQTVGLIAGWGDYPVVVARRLVESGYRVFTIGIAGHADETLREISHGYESLGVARFRSAIRFFQRNNVRHAMMAGKVFKHLMFQRRVWMQHFPDLTTLRYFWHQFVTGREKRNDDQMLLTVTRLFADFGIELMPATDFAPELLTPPGLVAGRMPSQMQLRDIEMGWQLAREMGRLDIGQSICIKSRAVLAVEAIEGTDECIRRAGRLCPAGGFTVVKVAKPHQDMRFDVPTIGPGTIDAMSQSGGGVLAIEGGRTIILGREELITLAKRHGISVYAFDPGQFEIGKFQTDRVAA